MISVPRYWMVALACLLMITTVVMEYLRILRSTQFSGVEATSASPYVTLSGASQQAETYGVMKRNEFIRYNQSMIMSTKNSQTVEKFSFTNYTSPVQVLPKREQFKLKQKQWHKMQRYHVRNRGQDLTGDLLNLVGIQLPPFKTLHQRGFSLWQNSSTVAQHLQSLWTALNQVTRNVTSRSRSLPASLNPDIVTRGNFQRQQMKGFCNINNIARLPSTPASLGTLFTHLLYDDSKKVVFCYVPKNGCSNMKRVLLILNGLLPPNSSQMSRPSENILKQVRSFKTLTPKEAIYKLQNYYKFAIIRNPMERLLSAYRNKLEHPLVFSDRKHFPSSVQLFIMSLFRPSQVKTWLQLPSHETHSIFPSFKEFITYMKMFPLGDYNEHFTPFSELCHPCSVDYDFYANFKTMDYDVAAILDYLSIPSTYYPSQGSFKHNTAELMGDYFRLISHREKLALFNSFKYDLNLYYSLYPEESESHKDLL